MRLPALLVFCAVVLAMLARAPGTLAEPAAPTAADVARAAQLKAQGDEHFDALRYADAITFYFQVYAIVRDPVVLYNIGRAHQALGRYPQALAELRRFEAEAPPEVKARVPMLAGLIAEVNARVARLEIECNVAGARVFVRGELVGKTPLPPATPVEAGKAVVEVKADGYGPFRAEVDLPGGGSAAIDVLLVAENRQGMLVIHSPIAGAIVSVDGRSAGNAPIELSVQPGTHSIAVRAEGYDEARTSAVVALGEHKRIDIDLARQKPVTSRWWFWATAGAVVAGGIVVTVALLRERPADHGDFSPGQTSAPLRVHF